MKRIPAALIVLVLFAFASFLFLYAPEKNSCQITSEERTVQGESLPGIIAPGRTVTLLRGYYGCNDIARGDIVAYAFAGNDSPIIKRALGISGDQFELREANEGLVFNIFINDRELLTTRGAAYELSSTTAKVLRLYEHDYGGVIPPKAYLILGNIPEGTTDSIQFGFVSHDDIIGKVIY